jgi:uncharacterized membrane protein
MAGRGVTAPTAWFEEHSRGAPAPLCERAGHYLEARNEAGLAGRLAAAAGTALDHVLSQRGDRAAALDLLAADALVTLALKARALEQPDALAAFAAEILARGSRP